MSDNSKKKQDKPSDNGEEKKRGHYDKPLQVNGDFMDFMNTVIKDAKKKDKVIPSKNNDKDK